VTAKDTREKTDAQATTKQKLISRLIVFPGGGLPKLEIDGEFELDITGEQVTGKHRRPDEHPVAGTLKGDIIFLDEDDRTHKGVLIDNKHFIGKMKVKTDDAFEQEEGVWVGTKNP
jgi:hypothetical protein